MIFILPYSIFERIEQQEPPMDKELAIQSLTDTMAKFTAYIGKRLPKDVKAN